MYLSNKLSPPEIWAPWDQSIIGRCQTLGCTLCCTKLYLVAHAVEDTVESGWTTTLLLAHSCMQTPSQIHMTYTIWTVHLVCPHTRIQKLYAALYNISSASSLSFISWLNHKVGDWSFQWKPADVHVVAAFVGNAELGTDGLYFKGSIDVTV